MSICFNPRALLQDKKFSGGLSRKSVRLGYLAAIFMLSIIFTGCQSVMSTSSPNSGPTKAPNVYPLTFKEHEFEAYCYNTLRCRVIYKNFNFTLGIEETPSGSPPSPDYKKNWNASYTGVRNFPPPADVRWTSLDGSNHEAKVDIGKIFRDERVLHNVPEPDYAEGSFDGNVDIFLEVNDRTINVYMKAIIATKTKQIPGNEHSYGRDDLILAWSHTY